MVDDLQCPKAVVYYECLPDVGDEFTLVADDDEAALSCIQSLLGSEPRDNKTGNILFHALEAGIYKRVLEPFIQQNINLNVRFVTQPYDLLVFKKNNFEALRATVQQMRTGLEHSACVVSLCPNKHAETVNNHWNYRSSHSLAMIKGMLAMAGTHPETGALGVEVQGELVSWCLIYRYGALGMLFTKEGYRKRGYARYLVGALTLQLYQAGRLTAPAPPPPFAYTSDSSRELFRSLGYEYALTCTWIGLKHVTGDSAN